MSVINTHWRSKGGVGRDNDAFYTKPDVADVCVCDVLTHVNAFDLVIEPSAGDGAFVNSIKCRLPTIRLVAIDIDPSADSIVKHDFYKTTSTYFDITASTKVLVIGNPPFGKNASDAIAFFNHAASIGAHTIAFIVPRSFRKPSVIDRLDLNYQMIHDADLPINSFRFRPDNKTAFVECDVPTTLQVWTKGATQRAKMVSRKRAAADDDSVIRFVSTAVARAAVDGAKFCDMTIQRVGVAAGRVSLDRVYINSKKNSGNYYFVSVLNADRLQEIRADVVKFSRHLENTPGKLECAGMPSISKAELIESVDIYFAASQPDTD